MADFSLESLLDDILGLASFGQQPTGSASLESPVVSVFGCQR